MQRYAGIAMIIGAIMFIGGVMTPVMLDVFGEIGNPAVQLEYLENNQLSWDLSNMVNGLGAFIAGVGFAFLAWDTRKVNDNNALKIFGSLGTGAIFVGGIFWFLISLWRVLQSPYDIAYNSSSISWLFDSYNYLTMVGVVLSGFIMSRISRPRWAGWLLLSFGILFVIAFIVLGDVPPGVYYPFFFIVGCILAIGSRSPSHSTLIFPQ